MSLVKNHWQALALASATQSHDSSSLHNGSRRAVLCFDRADGKLRWQKDVAYTDRERNWDQKWYANASPATTPPPHSHRRL